MAPPTMAMMMSDDASFTCSPRFLVPSAKMVGNMMDMKKLADMIATTAVSPVAIMPVRYRPNVTMEKAVSSRCGWMNDMSHVPTNRPTMKRMKLNVRWKPAQRCGVRSSALPAIHSKKGLSASTKKKWLSGESVVLKSMK